MRDGRLTGGRLAALEPDPLRPGSLVLTIDGAEQSHLDPADPLLLAWEYVARIGAVIDAVAAPGAPLRVLHLGAGALTLPRYVQATRPGSEQEVIEAVVGLVDVVLDAAPLPPGTRLRVRTGDAASALPTGGRYDLAILDVYAGARVPEHLLEPAFFAALARLLPGGLLVANAADEPGLPLTARMRAAAATVFPRVHAVAPTQLVEGGSAGNAIVLASDGGAAGLVAEELLRHGPHPVSAVP